MDCVSCFARRKHTIALYSKNRKHMLPLHCVFCQKNTEISPIGCHKHWLCLRLKIIWFACFSETIAGYSCLRRAPLLESKCVNLTGKSKHTKMQHKYLLVNGARLWKLKVISSAWQRAIINMRMNGFNLQNNKGDSQKNSVGFSFLRCLCLLFELWHCQILFHFRMMPLVLYVVV